MAGYYLVCCFHPTKNKWNNNKKIMEKSMRTILIGHRTQWSLFSSSSSIVAIVSIFSKYWYLFIKHSTHQRFKQLPTYKTLESKLHYGKKTPFLSLHQCFFFFLLFCSSLFVVVTMYLVWCDRPEIILKEPVDVENTWSTSPVCYWKQ